MPLFCHLFHVPFLCSLARVFISWLTAHSLMNHFTLNARVSGVRISAAVNKIVYMA